MNSPPPPPPPPPYPYGYGYAQQPPVYVPYQEAPFGAPMTPRESFKGCCGCMEARRAALTVAIFDIVVSGK